MRHSTTCKFCHSPLFIEISDEYAELGDPFKLLPLAACNNCADLRVKRRSTEDAIKRVCTDLIQLRKKPEGDTLRIVTETLTSLTQRYCKIIAEWHNMSGMAWDFVMVEMLIEKPERWGDLLSQTWKQFRLHCLTKPETVQPELA